MMRRMKLRNALLPALVLAATVLSACAPVALTAAAGATTTKAAAEERGLGGSAKDAGTRIAVNDLWFKHDAEMYRRVGLQVYDGRLLLTGIVPSEDMRDAAVKLAWQPENVTDVINEIKVDNTRGLDTYAVDTWVSTQVKTKLIFDKSVSSINYRVRTVDGTVYLLGVAQSQVELDRVFEIVRNQTNVDQVVSHVLLKDDPRREAS